MKRRDIKVAIATGKVPAQLGASQIQEVYTGRAKRAMTAREAGRHIAMVSLGKRSIIYRIGLDVTERPFAIEELATMLKRERGGGRGPRWPLSMEECRVAAAVALDELAVDMCHSCGGRGMLAARICPDCSGTRRRAWTAKERLATAGGRAMLDLAWAQTFSAAITHGKEILERAEFAATSSAADMAGGWGTP